MLFINGLVLHNSILHNPLVGYDAKPYAQYIVGLGNGRLPQSSETKEFFSPPLPFLFPALLASARPASLVLGLKAGQLLNVVISVGVTLSLLKVCQVVRPGDRRLQLCSLGFFGILPVYYKTLSFPPRGEPFVLLFTMLAVQLLLERLFSGEVAAVGSAQVGLVGRVRRFSTKRTLLILVGLLAFAGIALLLIQRALLADLAHSQIEAAYSGRALPLVNSLFRSVATDMGAKPVSIYLLRADAFLNRGWVLGLILLFGGLPLLIRLAFPGARELAFGLSLGLLLLSRQWGFLVFVGLGLFIALLLVARHPMARVGLRWMISGSCLAFLISGWFYLSLLHQYGTPAAFNRPPKAGFSLSNQPASFYFGLGDGRLFTEPIRGSFVNQLLPILYSETWGDYWCYFSADGRGAASIPDARACLRPGQTGRTWLPVSQPSLGAYLGRVNLVSLVPSLLAASALALGLISAGRVLLAGDKTMESVAAALLTMIFFACLGGFTLFMIMFPSESGKTIKASYVLQVFPLIAILAGLLLTRIHSWKPSVCYGFLLALAAVCMHNLGAMITQ